jgi:hypothetical protein
LRRHTPVINIDVVVVVIDLDKVLCLQT